MVVRRINQCLWGFLFVVFVAAAINWNWPREALLGVGHRHVPLADSEQAMFRALDGAAAGNDRDGLALLASGDVVPIAGGTRVSVLDVGDRFVRVKILDGKYAGRTGYTPAKFLDR